MIDRADGDGLDERLAGAGRRDLEGLGVDPVVRVDDDALRPGPTKATGEPVEGERPPRDLRQGTNQGTPCHGGPFPSAGHGGFR